MLPDPRTSPRSLDHTSTGIEVRSVRPDQRLHGDGCHTTKTGTRGRLSHYQNMVHSHAHAQCFSLFSTPMANHLSRGSVPGLTRWSPLVVRMLLLKDRRGVLVGPQMHLHTFDDPNVMCIIIYVSNTESKC